MEILDFLGETWYNRCMKSEEKTVTSNTENVTISRAEYESLKAENAELTHRLDWMAERLKLSNKKLFGASSERRTEELSNQLCLFNEAEAFSDEKQAEPDIAEVKSHYRKKSKARDRLFEDWRLRW